MKNKEKIRILKSNVYKYIFITISCLFMIPLFFIIFEIIVNGIKVINFNFLFSLPKPIGEEGGGILNSIIGTLELVIVGSIIAIPLGMAIGIFLAENQKLKFTKFLKFLIDLLQGVPSIVIGIVVYLWIVKPMNHFSAFSGSVALALIMLPVVIKSTEEFMKLVPLEIKEAALSLGVPYYKTIIKVILPVAFPGILSGILIGIARAAGETAPLLFTAFGNPYLSFDIFKPINSLPLAIFVYSVSPYQTWHNFAWGASFILLAFIIILKLLATFKIRKK
ncbi:MAG: phosphate ABC transporter permease PstA [Bacteroidales bacterium]|nr:phosphate ABC transporter permease PstA [Bacteroidales bacterium]